MFYFSAPFLFYVIKTKKLFFSQAVILLAIGFILVGIFSVYPYKGFFGSLPFMFSSTFFGRCFEFFLGIYLALVVINSKESQRKFKAYTLTGALLFSLLLFVTAMYAFTYEVPSVNKTPSGNSHTELRNASFYCTLLFWIDYREKHDQKLS